MKRRRLQVLVGIALLTAPVAQADLQTRLGGQALYDTDRDITWLADAGLPQTELFGVCCLAVGAFEHWDQAVAWVVELNNAHWLGRSDWRLPTAIQPDLTCSTQDFFGSTGIGCTGSELGHMYHVELGVPENGGGVIENGDPEKLALISNLDNAVYWTETVVIPGQRTYSFSLANGFQSANGISNNARAWPVVDGDVFAASVPALPPAGLVFLGLVFLGLGVRSVRSA
jgi:hypothetical protein